MYYSYVEIEYVATSFSPTRTDFALKLLRLATNLKYAPRAPSLGWADSYYRFDMSVTSPCTPRANYQTALQLRLRKSDTLLHTKHLCRNAQSCTRTSSPALRRWCGEPATSEPDSTVRPSHTSSVWPWLGVPKVWLYGTVSRQLTPLTPTNEESAWAQ